MLKKKKDNKNMVSGGIFFVKDKQKNLKELNSFFPKTIVKNCSYLSKQLIFFEVDEVNFNRFLSILSVNSKKFISKSCFLWSIWKNSNILNIDYNNIDFFFKKNQRILSNKFYLLIVKLYIDLFNCFNQIFFKMLRILMMKKGKEC